MAEYNDKWEKDFLKRYTTAVDTLNSIEAELTQMKLDNPDTWELTFLFPDIGIDETITNDFFPATTGIFI